MLNPLSGVVEAFRLVLLPSRAADWMLIGVSVVTSVLVFVFGLVYFTKTEKAFADVI
jgi:ABC-type polysaccharide/polyol phosphate export permease